MRFIVKRKRKKFIVIMMWYILGKYREKRIKSGCKVCVVVCYVCVCVC